MAESDPGRGPDAAHSLLGLPETASHAELEGAYWRLRGHIEARLESSDASSQASSDDPARASKRRSELARLHAAYVATPGVDASAIAPPGATRAAHRTPPWLIAWAIVASLVAVVLGLWRVVAPSSAPTEPDPGASLEATLTIESDPPTAELTVTTGEDERVVLGAPADGTPRSLPAGVYGLAVAHPDCPDAWRRSATLAPGEERTYAPRICQGQGSLVVRSNASDDRLRIDGLDVGSTGAETHALRVGPHRVLVEKEGYEPWTADVRIEPDTEKTLIAELRRKADTPSQSAGAAQPPPTGRQAPARSAANPTAGRTPDGLQRPASGNTPARVRTGPGGSKSWHDAIVHDLVSRFDRNGSGSLDTTDEIQSIPCETWRGVEQSYETGGLAVTMTHLYGFDGSEAPANTLGVTNAMRGYAYDRMKACGLEARR